MNAVNLIPKDSRRARRSISISRPTLALFGGMVIVLVAAVVYVSAANTVTARRVELSRVTAAATRWTAAANSYATLAQAAQQRSAQLADVRQLVSGRYAWSQLLSQLGGLMPAASALSSLQATTTPALQATTTPAASPADPPQPAVQLTGCAASQSVVAQVMQQLQRVNGVTGVTLSSASSADASGTPGAGGCPYPVVFQLSLTFGSSAPSAASGSVAAPTSTTSGTTTTPGTAATASATPTSTTGAAQ